MGRPPELVKRGRDFASTPSATPAQKPARAFQERADGVEFAVMPHRVLSVAELTKYLHLMPGDVERLLRETDIPHTVRGQRPVFVRSEIDAWASQRILGLPDKRLDVYHAKTVRGTREQFPQLALIPELLDERAITLTLAAKTRASVIREMVALAETTGHVLDGRELQQSVGDREAMCPTALEGGFALLHARHHAPFRFEHSFIALGRTIQGVPFGAPDGRPTRLFFLVCCEDDRIHLHALARLCLMAQKTHVIAELLAAESPAAAHASLRAAEAAVLPAADELARGRL